MTTPASIAAPKARRRAPASVRLVALFDALLGLWAFALAAGYVYLWFENYRVVIDGRKVGNQGAFVAILVNAGWAAGLLGMDDVPGGRQSDFPGGPPLAVLGTFRMMGRFPGLAIGYLALGGACLALADGLHRGRLRARRAQAVVGWLGLAAVAAYGGLYLLTPKAPKAGLFVVAAAALVPAMLVVAARRSGVVPERSPRARVGLPGWTLIALGLAAVALAAHLVLAWWGLLALKFVVA